MHDLQLLNGVTIKESSIPPNLDQLVDQFLGGKLSSPGPPGSSLMEEVIKEWR